MKTWTKRILTVSAATAGAGLVLMGIGMGMGGRPGVVFTKDGISSSYQPSEPYSQKKTSVDAFSNLKLDIEESEADIRILPSGDDKYYVEYLLDGESNDPVCEVKDDTLTISQTYSDVHMVGVFGITLDSYDPIDPYIFIYVPEDAALKKSEIYNDYGDINIADTNMETVSVHAEYGDVTLDNVSSKAMDFTLTDGEFLADSLKTDAFSLVSSYGSATIRESALSNAELQLEYGDLQCDTVEAEQFKVNSTDGDVQMKEASCKNADFTLAYGNLELDAAAMDTLNCKSEYGDISLLLPDNIQDYQLDIALEYGDLTLPKDALLNHYINEENGGVTYQADAVDEKSEKIITIQSLDGNVEIGYR